METKLRKPSNNYNFNQTRSYAKLAIRKKNDVKCQSLKYCLKIIDIQSSRRASWETNPLHFWMK